VRYSAFVARPTAALFTLATILGVGSTAFATGGVRNGPWLMEPRTDSITVMIERVAAGPVTVTATPIDGSAPPAVRSDTATTTLHEIRMSGLRAGTRYRYEVSGDALETRDGNFSTAPAEAVPFRFVIYGDTRSDVAIHTRMARAIHEEAADFVLHTGDLVSDGRDLGRWRTFFDIERDLLRDAPLVPVIGNHEIMRPGSSGVDAFRRYVHCDPSSPAPELDYTFGYGSVRFVVLNAFDDWTSRSRRAWLDAALTRARAEVPNGFLVVAMHWGTNSCGPHGENHAARSAGIDDMFRAHHVDLLVSGHDHIFERGEDDGLRYIVSGGGGAPLYRRARVHRYARAFASEYHFVRADVERDAIVFTAVRPDGTTLDRCTLRHSGWDCPRSPIAPRVTVADMLLPSCACRAAGASRCGKHGALAFVALALAGWSVRRKRSGILPRP
jgi:predicted phosphodiesterase